MDETGWTVRFRGYLPIDHQLQERLQRVIENIDRVPESAIEIDNGAKVVTIDYSQVKDWASQSSKIARVLRFGDRIVVRPPWEDYAPVDGEAVITIDAGPIFGTGLHETTALCLEALERRITPGCSALDFGTGSGILAIASAKLGAARVAAIETDPEAVEIAKANVAANQAQSIVTVVRGSSAGAAGGDWDVITANIVPSVIIPNLRALRDVMAPNAVIVLSGLTVRTTQEVEPELAGAGLAMVDKSAKGSWVALEVEAR